MKIDFIKIFYYYYFMNFKFIFLSTLFILYICIGSNFTYSSSFNVCGIDFNHNWFEVKDDSNNTVFLLDKDGDVFIMGKNNVGNNPALRSFKINDAIYFNSKDAPLNKIFQTSSFPAEKGILFKDSSANNIAKLTTSGLYVKGTPVYQGAQAKCPADGWGYCNANNQFLRDNRNYYCDITGSLSADCKYTVVSTTDCRNSDYYTCSGLKTKILKHFNCGAGGGNCVNYNDEVLGDCGAYQYCYGTAQCGNFVWSTGSWGSCSALCGSGTQTRSVTCTRSHDGAVVDNSYCNPSTKPATSQGCSVSCSWNTGSWESCSTLCGSGTQYRPVYCTNQNGAIIPDYYCSGSKPATSQSCHTGSCSWSIGSWSSCNNLCGYGTQNRPVYCIRQNGAVIPDYYCSGSKPATTQSCLSSCYWFTPAYDRCSQACGGGIQYNYLNCAVRYMHSSGVYIEGATDLRVCEKALGYKSSYDSCNTQACSGSVYPLGPWQGNCNRYGGTWILLQNHHKYKAQCNYISLYACNLMMGDYANIDYGICFLYK